jgi:hypothetical protein
VDPAGARRLLRSLGSAFRTEMIRTPSPLGAWTTTIGDPNTFTPISGLQSVILRLHLAFFNLLKRLHCLEYKNP